MSELVLGSAAPTRTFGPITRTDIVRYAGASGDFNPIHHDDGVARAAGFPSVFSIGMLQAALLSTVATDWLGARAVRRVAFRFREQVWPEDVLTCDATIVGIDHIDGERRASVELTCRRQTGAVAVTASAEFVLGQEAEGMPHDRSC